MSETPIELLMCGAADVCLVSKCLKLLMDSYKIDFWISLEEPISKCPKLPLNS